LKSKEDTAINRAEFQIGFLLHFFILLIRIWCREYKP